MPIYDAAMQYQQAGVPLIVLAGKEYGSGSSRDWAAKGTMLLGVKAVIAESFERIHRSNLVNMGVLPLQFMAGETAAAPRPHRPRSVRVDRRRRGAEAARRRHRDGHAPRTARRRRFTRDGPHRHAGGADGVLARRHPAVRAASAGQEAAVRSLMLDSADVKDARARSSGSTCAASRRRRRSPNWRCLREWLARGYAGEMVYLHKSRRHARRHPAVPALGASVIVTGTLYNTDGQARRASRRRQRGTRADAVRVARYARGEDYHHVLAERLEALVAWMRDAARRRRSTPRIFVDKHHVQERVFAHARRHRLDRQEHLRDQPRARLVDVAGRRRHQPRPRARRARRSISAAPARCASTRARPARSSMRTSSTRRSASRISPSSSKARFRERSGRTSAITSSDATSARTCARGTSRRRRQPIPPGSRDGVTAPRAAELWQRTDQELHGMVKGSAMTHTLAVAPAPEPGADHRQHRRARRSLPSSIARATA